MRFLIFCLLLLSSAAAFSQTVKRITVKGNREVSVEAITLAMKSQERKPYSADVLPEDEANIFALGFFRSVKVTPFPTPDGGKELVVDVVEWPVVKSIRIEGNTGVRTDEILKFVEAPVGKIFNQRTVVPSVEKIRDLYKRRGLLADVSEFKMPEDQDGLLLIRIFELKVHEIEILGTRRVTPETARRFIYTKPGDVFERDRWEADLRRLYATGWYNDIQSFRDLRDDGTMDVTAQLFEGKTGKLSGGLMADPGSPLVGTVSFGESNFHNSGQSIAAMLSHGIRGGGPGIDIAYANPLFDRHNTTLSVNLYSKLAYRFAGTSFQENDAPDQEGLYSERRSGFAARFSRSLSDYVSASIGLRWEAVTTNDLKSSVTEGFIRQDGNLATLQLAIERNRRDTDVEPARGDWLRIEVEPGFSHISKVGGDVSNSSYLGDRTYLKSTAEYRAYMNLGKSRELSQLGDPRPVLAFRARYGLIAGDVPFAEQYFVGGASSIRGYADDRFWGKQTILATLEYRQPISDAFMITAFGDLGGAWGGYGNIGEFRQSHGLNLNLGYGLGFTYRVPKIGPLRLDFGFDSKGKLRTHFSIGTSF